MLKIFIFQQKIETKLININFVSIHYVIFKFVILGCFKK